MTSCFCTGECTKLGYCPNTRIESLKNKEETPQDKARRLGVKVYEEKPKDWSPQRPNPIIGVCGRCNKEIRLNMNMDMCYDSDCPADIGPKLC